MNPYSNPFSKQIYEMISPLVGDMMSRGALRAQCKKLSIDEESIKRENLNEISKGIKLGLTLFLGTEGAHNIAEKIMRL
jgi:hypothetical protein